MGKKIFVSHASADAAFIDKFVERILVVGLELKDEDLFYSSGTDTGVPAGSDLYAFMRDEVEESALVIAIITPAYLTRPTCVAELGAGWSYTGKLLPLLAPGLKRSGLEGILGALQTPYIDDKVALGQLAGRVMQAVGATIKPAKWGLNLETWLADVDSLAEKITEPDVVTREQLKAEQATAQNLRDALDAATEERRALEDQIERYKAAETDEERAEALLPDGLQDRLSDALTDVRDALKGLGDEVRETVRNDACGQPTWAANTYEDSDRYARFESAAGSGLLKVDSEDGSVSYDLDYPQVEEAVDALAALESVLTSIRKDDDTVRWFKDEYGVPPKMGLAVLDALKV